MVTKLMVGAAIAGAAAMGMAAPAGAEPSPFDVLSCSCPPTVPKGGPSVADQIDRGIETALTDLEGTEVPQ